MGLAVPAYAQLAPGVSGWSSAPTSASEGEYWAMMSRFGHCIARTKKDEAVAFLSSKIDSPEESKAFKALFGRARNMCMGNFVSAQMLRSHVRGVVAEGLLERMTSWQAPGDLDVQQKGPEQVTGIHDFAACYAATHPLEARGLLNDTRVGSKGEVEYVRQIASGFDDCLPLGMEVRIYPIDFRMAIAEALYHAAHQAPQLMTQGTE